jgi:DNA-binding winged helix-turn-helix (wHTH) protein/Tol biopolymer transport system component
MKYKFGDLAKHDSEYNLCTKSEKLRDGEQNSIKIEHQQYELLLLFLENPNQLLSRDKIVERVWFGRETSDEAIRVALKKLRDILNDNPKSPNFIKTIPKQGYKWIADVDCVADLNDEHNDEQNDELIFNLDTGKVNAASTSDSAGWQKYKLVVFISLAVILSFIYIWSMFDTANQPLNKDNIVIEPITTMAGSEVVADYHHKTKKLAFLHRAERGEPQQLYVKYLATNEVLRLTWNDQNYSNVNWSPDGAKLAFTHYAAAGKVLYVATFDQDNTLQDIASFSNEQLSNKSVSDWTSNGESLLLAAEFIQGKSHSIYQFDLQTQSLTPISFPNTSGRGDYMAKQSEDGKFTAILRESEPGKIVLVIIDTISGDAFAEHSLDFTPSYMLWSADSEEVSLSSFFGEHLRFNLPNKVVSYSPVLPADTLDIFAHCGAQCYILRRHNGDFLDIQEKPLTSIFAQQDVVSLVGVSRLFKTGGAQDFPIYMPSTDQLVYASLSNQTLSIERVTNGSTNTIAKLDGSYQLTSLSISPSGDKLVGSIENRLFTTAINQINSLEVSFITDALEQTSNPVWAPDGQHIFFSSYLDKMPTIFQLNIDTNKRTKILNGALSFSILESGTNALVISPDLTASIYKNTDENWQKSYDITQLQSANPNRWKLINEYLYFTKYENYDALLCRVNWRMSETTPDCQSIGKNRFRLHFDIDALNNRVLMVESLSAQSDIIKMAW